MRECHVSVTSTILMHNNTAPVAVSMNVLLYHTTCCHSLDQLEPHSCGCARARLLGSAIKLHVPSAQPISICNT